MTREEQIINFVTEKYKSLMYGKGNTPEGNGYLVAMGDVLRFVDKLPKEQEPQGLDEAAEEYGSRTRYTEIPAFKAGAKWMAEQGDIFQAEISNIGFLPLPKLNISAGEKVIVQIRKK